MRTRRWRYTAVAINQFVLRFVVRICSFLSLYSSSSTFSLMIVSLGSPPNRKGDAFKDNHGLTKYVLTNASLLASQNS